MTVFISPNPVCVNTAIEFALCYVNPIFLNVVYWCYNKGGLAVPYGGESGFIVVEFLNRRGLVAVNDGVCCEGDARVFVGVERRCRGGCIFRLSQCFRALAWLGWNAGRRRLRAGLWQRNGEVCGARWFCVCRLAGRISLS